MKVFRMRRFAACAALLVLNAACNDATRAATDDDDALGAITGGFDRSKFVTDTMVMTMAVLDAGSLGHDNTYQPGETVSGVALKATVADPTIARVTETGNQVTAVREFDTPATAVFHIELLKEGATTVTVSAPGRTAAGGGELKQTFRVTALTPVRLVLQLPSNVPRELPAVFDVSTAVRDLPLNAYLIASNGDRLPAPSVTWSCTAGTSVATVRTDQGTCTGDTGYFARLTAASTGTATIRVALNGELGRRFPLTLDQQVRVTAPLATIAVDAPATIVAGEHAHVSIKLFDAAGNRLPDDLTSPWQYGPTYQSAVDWVSDDQAVFMVGFFDADLVASSPGVANLTARLVPPGELNPIATATAPVRVTGTTNIVTVQPAPLNIVAGGRRQLTATVTTATGQPLTAPITWLSQNVSIATVDASGVVTGVSTGEGSPATATVTILARAGGAQGSVTVTVYRAVSTVTVSPTTVTLHPGDTQQFTAILRDNAGNVIPATATSLQWSSPNPSVFSVNQSGVVTAASVSPDALLVRVATAEGVNGSAEVKVIARPTGGAATALVLSPHNPGSDPATNPTGVAGSVITFTARLIDANGVAVAPPAGGTIGIATDVSSIAQVESSSYNPTTFVTTAVVRLRSAGVTAVRGFLQVGSSSTFSDFTNVTVTP